MSARARRRLVVGNPKMNLTERQSVAVLDDLLPRLAAERTGTEVAVAPSFPCLRAVADRLAGTDVTLAAQNLHWEDKGAFTGEVSPLMLVELGVRWVLAGHSERRAHFGDTDERVGRKVRAAVRHGMVPILCVGEQEADRNAGRTLEVVERQLRLGLEGVELRSGTEAVIAYEPVWAIGTGRVATPEQADEVHRLLRQQLAAHFGAETAKRTRILYGGSVTAQNAPSLLSLEEVDGALLGGTSLDAAGFTAVVRAAG
jgi:triosephosphate isomerase